VTTPVAAALLLALAALPAQGSAAARPPAYPLHRNVTATVFWIGEPVGNGSTENNAVSAYDDLWLRHYGGVDDPGPRRAANGWFPPAFAPGENPFYADVPYDDFDDGGNPRPDRMRVVPWAGSLAARVASYASRGQPYSLMKNRWIRLRKGRRVCYAQIEDAGPYVYDDAAYVFGPGAARPRSRRARNAGLDVSPAVRDCLGFAGLNNDANRVDWQFVVAAAVPPGPWRRVVTTRQVFWR
jgi:hypothetical protein